MPFDLLKSLWDEFEKATQQPNQPAQPASPAPSSTGPSVLPTAPATTPNPWAQAGALAQQPPAPPVLGPQMPRIQPRLERVLEPPKPVSIFENPAGAVMEGARATPFGRVAEAALELLTGIDQAAIQGVTNFVVTGDLGQSLQAAGQGFAGTTPDVSVNAARARMGAESLGPRVPLPEPIQQGARALGFTPGQDFDPLGFAVDAAVELFALPSNLIPLGPADNAAKAARQVAKALPANAGLPARTGAAIAQEIVDLGLKNVDAGKARAIGELIDLRANVAEAMYGTPKEDFYAGIQLRRGTADDLAVAAADGALAQGSVPKGLTLFTEEGERVIAAFESADVSTFVHELAHVWRRDTPTELLAPFEKWAGVVDGNWTREAEERFARGFEAYLRDGQAPSAQIKALFDEFRTWLTAIYRVITGTPLDVRISPEVRAAYDALIDVDAARQAQAASQRTGGVGALAQATKPGGDGPLGELDRPRALAQDDVAEPTIGRTVTAVGPDQKATYEFRYRVVDLDELIPSHTDALGENPAFPAQFQPRQRGAVVARGQVDEIARNLLPNRLLVDSGDLERGPMIIGPDRLVESGNGRVLGLRKAAREFPEQFDKYRAALVGRAQEFGLDPAVVDAIDYPVLVRERVTPLDDAQRSRFVADSNIENVLRMSDVEQARVDAVNLKDSFLSKLTFANTGSVEEALKLPANRDFIRSFAAEIPAHLRQSIADDQGNLTRKGLERITDALFARTYSADPSGALLKMHVSDLDPTLTRIGQALHRTLAPMATLEAMIRAGVRDRDLSLADDVALAVAKLIELKQSGTPVAEWAAQLSMFGDELTPLQKQLVQFFDTYANKPTVIQRLLRNYVDAAIDRGNPQQVDMFLGQRESKETLLPTLLNNAGEWAKGAVDEAQLEQEVQAAMAARRKRTPPPGQTEKIDVSNTDAPAEPTPTEVSPEAQQILGNGPVQPTTLLGPDGQPLRTVDASGGRPPEPPPAPGLSPDENPLIRTVLDAQGRVMSATADGTHAIGTAAYQDELLELDFHDWPAYLERAGINTNRLDDTLGPTLALFAREQAAKGLPVTRGWDVLEAEMVKYGLDPLDVAKKIETYRGTVNDTEMMALGHGATYYIHEAVQTVYRYSNKYGNDLRQATPEESVEMLRAVTQASLLLDAWKNGGTVTARALAVRAKDYQLDEATKFMAGQQKRRYERELRRLRARKDADEAQRAAIRAESNLTDAERAAAQAQLDAERAAKAEAKAKDAAEAQAARAAQAAADKAARDAERAVERAKREADQAIKVALDRYFRAIDQGNAAERKAKTKAERQAEKAAAKAERQAQRDADKAQRAADRQAEKDRLARRTPDEKLADELRKLMQDRATWTEAQWERHFKQADLDMERAVKEMDAAQQRIMRQIENDAAEKAKRARKLLDAASGQPVDLKLLNEWQKIVQHGDPVAAANFLRGLKHVSMWDRVQIIRYGAMLSAVSTHLTNIIGNTTNLALELVMIPVAGGFDLARSAITKGERQRYMMELRPALLGLGEGAITGLRDGLTAVITGVDPKAAEKWDVTHIQQGFGAEKLPVIGKPLDAVRVPKTGVSAATAINTTLEMPLRLLSAADQFFRSVSYGAYLRREVYREAKRQLYGEVPRGEVNYRLIADRSDKIIANIVEYPHILEDAERLARRAIFQEKRETTRLIGGLRERANLPTGLGFRIRVGDMIMPFLNVPVNIASQGIALTPLGYFGALESGRKAHQANKKLASLKPVLQGVEDQIAEQQDALLAIIKADQARQTEIYHRVRAEPGIDPDFPQPRFQKTELSFEQRELKAGLARNIEEHKAVQSQLDLAQRESDVALGDMADQLARATIGSSIMVGALVLAELGLVSGPMPESDSDRNKLNEGWQPWSVKIGDRWWSYQNLGPVGYPFAIAGMYKAAADKAGVNISGEVAAQVVTGLGKYTMDQTFLKGVRDLLNAISEPTSGRWERLASGIAQQFIPFRAFSQNWQRFIDLAPRDPHGAAEVLLSGLPPMLADEVKPREDRFGNPIPVQSGAASALPRTQVERSDRIREALRQYNVTVGEPNTTITIGSVQAKLTVDEQYTLRHTSGQTMWHGLGWALDQRWFQALPDVEKGRVLKQIVDQSNALARESIAATKPELVGPFTERNRLEGKPPPRQQTLDGMKTDIESYGRAINQYRRFKGLVREYGVSPTQWERANKFARVVRDTAARLPGRGSQRMRDAYDLVALRDPIGAMAYEEQQGVLDSPMGKLLAEDRAEFRLSAPDMARWFTNALE